jgi:hypothetical protein
MGTRHLTAFVLALALAAAWPKAGTAAQLLSCRSASQWECRAAGCERTDLHADLRIDLGRQEIIYCAGEGCSRARAAMVTAEDGGLSFAFDATPEDGRRGGHVDRLVTLHPGGQAATIGSFLADGTVLFSPMTCGGR